MRMDNSCFLSKVSIARKLSGLSLFSLLIWLLNDLILYSFVLQQHHGPIKHVGILKSLLIMPRRTSTAQDTARDCFWHATKVKLPSCQADLRGELTIWDPQPVNQESPTNLTLQYQRQCGRRPPCLRACQLCHLYQGPGRGQTCSSSEGRAPIYLALQDEFSQLFPINPMDPIDHS